MRAQRLAAVLSFCLFGGLGAQKVEAKSEAIGTWQAMLPCPDCRGVRLRVSLSCEVGAEPRDCRYALVETYLGTRNGDITNPLQGPWSVERGTPADPEATVYRLTPPATARGEAPRFLLVLGQELRLLDHAKRALEPKEKYILRKVK